MVTLGKSSDRAYLAELLDVVPTSANVTYYAKQVAQFGQRKRLGALIVGAQDQLRDGDNPLEWLEAQLANLRGKESDVHHVGKVLKESWIEIEDVAASGNPLGYRTGILELDEMAMFQDGSFVVVAGRPGMGKSVLGAQYLDGDDPALIFTYEMKNSELCKRMLAGEAKVPLRKIRMGKFEGDDYAKLGTATERLNSRPLYFCEANKLSIQDLRAKARLMVRKYNIKKIVVDYLQLCYDNTAASREQEIASISRNLKAMALELDVCVV
jgi:replicative DNA helicase